MPFTQVLRWPPLPQSEGNTQSGIATYTPSSTQQGRGVVITLPDASYEPAAVAVLAGLYQIKPWSMLRADLTPQQQVHAAVLADMWQLTSARDAALGALLEPTKITDRASAGSPGVSDEQLDSFLSNLRAVRRSREQVSAALDQLLRLECMPDCLLPVFEQMLLSKYGHLEDAWADTALQQSLLALPLSAVELLLASDKLKVRPRPAVFGCCHGWCVAVLVVDIECCVTWCTWCAQTTSESYDMLSVKRRTSGSELDPRS